MMALPRESCAIEIPEAGWVSQALSVIPVSTTTNQNSLSTAKHAILIE
jgi:hypothetical protein